MVQDLIDALTTTMFWWERIQLQDKHGLIQIIYQQLMTIWKLLELKQSGLLILEILMDTLSIMESGQQF